MPFLLPIGMALLDSLSLPLVKYVYDGEYSKWYLVLPVLLFALQPIMVYFSLSKLTLTSVNIIWDLMSDVFVTFIGLWYFREKLFLSSKIGLLFAFIAIFFFSYSQKYSTKI